MCRIDQIHVERPVSLIRRRRQERRRLRPQGQIQIAAARAPRTAGYSICAYRYILGNADSYLIRFGYAVRELVIEPPFAPHTSLT